MLDLHALPWPSGARPPQAHVTCAPGSALARHEVRVRPRVPEWPRGDLLISAEPIPGLPVQGALATFSHGLAEHGLISRAPDGGLLVAIPETSDAWSDPAFLELLSVADQAATHTARSRGVGLLGFGAIGAEHARAVRHTAGLHLAAICDRDPERTSRALQSDPGATVHETAEQLIGDPGVDVVVVSTPPDSHAYWAMAALQHG